MRATDLKRIRRFRRKRGIRKRLFGTPERPRLSVYRSLNHIYAQVIDDLSGTTLASASSQQAKLSVTKSQLPHETKVLVLEHRG